MEEEDSFCGGGSHFLGTFEGCNEKFLNQRKLNIKNKHAVENSIWKGVLFRIKMEQYFIIGITLASFFIKSGYTTVMQGTYRA